MPKLYSKRPVYPHQKEIKQLVTAVIREFNEEEYYLIKNNLCERCINGRFAMHMQNRLQFTPFAGYTTDIEVDRGMGGNEGGKKMLSKKYDEDSYIYLDLIVYMRGYDNSLGFNNLLAIEFKKRGNSTESDHERLAVLVDDNKGFGYRAGFEIIIDRPSDNEHPKLHIEKEFYNLERGNYIYPGINDDIVIRNR